MIGFIIWSVVAIVLLGIGIWSWRSDKPVGFYTGVKPPEVNDVKKYNRSVGILWVVYALLFEVLGLPLQFLEQNNPGFLISILGAVFITIALVVVYNGILARNRK